MPTNSSKPPRLKLRFGPTPGAIILMVVAGGAGALVATLSGVLWPPAYAAQDDGGSEDQGNVDFMADITTLQSNVRRLAVRLSEVERRSTAAQQASADNAELSDLPRQMRAVLNSVRTLRARVDSKADRLGPNDPKPWSLAIEQVKALDARLKKLEKAGPPGEGSQSPGSTRDKAGGRRGQGSEDPNAPPGPNRDPKHD